jgi:hypothetical protein
MPPLIRSFAHRVARSLGVRPTPRSKPALKAETKKDQPKPDWVYDKARGSFEGREAILRQLLAFFPRGRLIDLACGNGMYSIAAHEMGWDVTAVDARTVRMPMTPGIAWVQQDVRETDVSGFDVVLVLGLLYHMELADQLDLLRRCSHAITILDTHHSTAPTHEEGGYAGHTFREIPEDHPTSLEDSPRAAWGNTTSFWATQPDLVRMLHDCGFATVLALVPPTLPNRTFYLCLPAKNVVARDPEATSGAA